MNSTFRSLALLVALAATGCGGGSPDMDGLEPKAAEILRAACERLAAANTLTLTSTEALERVQPSGEKKLVELTREMVIRRPNGFWIALKGAEKDASVWYDGSKLTVFQPKTKLYAQAAVPPSLDEVVDFLADRVPLNLPLADLIFSDPYAAYIGPETTGRWVGLEDVDGTQTHHLAFSDPAIDFEIWIEEGGQGLPKKLVLTYTGDESVPTSTIVFDSWEIDAAVGDARFSFKPPADSTRIQFAGQRQSQSSGS